MKILIGADIVPVSSNMEAFCHGNLDMLVDKDLKHLLERADFRIFNLEVPLTDLPTPIEKCGPPLIAANAAAKGIRAIGADFLTLANNHIMDQGAQGLHSTLQALERENLAYAGAGNTPEEAAKPYIFKKDGITVGIYCCAEHEFSIVTPDSPGANPFDPLWSLDHIQELKGCCDYVIVLYHGGKEHYPYPSPRLQQNCRRIVEKGADLVICQHSHCIGCREQWQEGTIVYGQGNFLFAKNTLAMWQTSLLVELELTAESCELKYWPLQRKEQGISLAKEEAAVRILNGFESRSREILAEGFVDESFAKYARESVSDYYGRSLGSRPHFVFRVLNKLLRNKLREKCYTPKDMLALINLLDCEAHRELYSAGLKQLFSSAKE